MLKTHMGVRVLVLMVLFVGSGLGQAAIGPEGETSEGMLGEGNTFSRIMPLEADSEYRISLWLRSSDVGADVSLTVNVHSEGAPVQVYRDRARLESNSTWRLLAVELWTDDAGLAEVVLSSNRPGSFFWDELSVARVDRFPGHLREYWEEKFATYGIVYTGLLVDARGLGLSRSMSPQVLSQSGQVVYNGAMASDDFVQRIGVVTYETELTSAVIRRFQVQRDYPFALPLYVEAIGTAGPFDTHVIIRDEDAERIFASLAAYDYLANYAVVFLLD